MSEDQNKHSALGKGPRNKTALQQYDRPWSVLTTITGDAILTDIRTEHANLFVKKLRERGITAGTTSNSVDQIKPVFDTVIREFELGVPNLFESLTMTGKGLEQPMSGCPMPCPNGRPSGDGARRTSRHEP
ncbi:hypothetical protein [Paracoccus nototheniae]|uniref:Uncharacterized protein n=1 Tax=Paracoccus nototheniae TaxID=2489002 RepID=A0ABW4E182_9RHOB|nr:hypothetical protein [Paracoccus nototheniae]